METSQIERVARLVEADLESPTQSKGYVAGWLRESDTTTSQSTVRKGSILDGSVRGVPCYQLLPTHICTRFQTCVYCGSRDVDQIWGHRQNGLRVSQLLTHTPRPGGG